MRAPKGYKVLKPVHPNAGIAAAYRVRLDDLVADMQESYRYWLTAAYRANEPAIAQDAGVNPKQVTAVQTNVGSSEGVWHVYVGDDILRGSRGSGRIFKSRQTAEAAGLRAAGADAILTEAFSQEDWRRTGISPHEYLRAPKLAQVPSANLQETLNTLDIRWTANFDAMAPKLARWFANSAGRRSEDGLKKILRDGGISVKFQMTPVMRDVFNATVQENVGLIKSIRSQYHSEVQGMVMRSVTAGRDLAMLTGELEDRFGITRRRAAKIALDQNNKATSSMVKVRQVEHGLLAIWLHSAGGKEPRKTHVANSGKVYDPAVGWLDPDPKVNKRIWPGELIHCRCVSRTVVKGFS